MTAKSRFPTISDYRTKAVTAIACAALGLHLLLYAGSTSGVVDLDSDAGLMPTLNGLFTSGSLVLVAVFALAAVIFMQNAQVSSRVTMSV